MYSFFVTFNISFCSDPSDGSVGVESKVIGGIRRLFTRSGSLEQLY